MGVRISSSRFVGRGAELSALGSAIEQASNRRPVLVLVAGEAGVGKTRLTYEFEHRVAASDGSVLLLRGEALPATDGELPLAPLVGALRVLVRDHHPAVEMLPAGDRAQLATLWPALAAEDGVIGGSPQADRLRLFESLRALITSACESAPVVLVIEDGHWADASTLAFLDFLVRSMGEERLAVVLTYRSDEPGRSSAWRRMLAELHRHRRVQHIALSRFDGDELEQALADILGQAPEPAALARLLNRSDGNPLYAEELLAAGLDGRGALPRSLGDAFLQRVERLGPAARRLTGPLAVGRMLDEPALAAVTELPAGEVSDALHEAMTAQVLVPGDGEAFCFRHALLREAVYDDLLPSRRSGLHLALARHRESELARAAGEDRELELALQVSAHYLASGDARSGLRASVRAADLASRAQAHDRAADLLADALELWPKVADAQAAASITHAQLLADAAAMHRSSDRLERARTLFSDALEEFEARGEPRQCAEILFQLSLTQQVLYRIDEATASARRALELIPQDDADPLRLAVRSFLVSRRNLYREGRAEAEALLQITIAAGNREEQGELLRIVAATLIRAGEVDAGLGRMCEAIALAEEIGDEARAADFTFSLAGMLHWAGRHGESVDLLRLALDATPASRVHRRDGLLTQMAMVTFAAGDWQRTRAALDAVTENTGDFGSRLRFVREAELAAGVGDWDRALACLRESAEVTERAPETLFYAHHASIAADVHARRGDLAAAEEVVAEATRRSSAFADHELRTADLHAVGVRVYAERAERARDRGDRAGLEAATALAAEHLSQLEVIESIATPPERAQLVEARIHLLRAQGLARADHWIGAVTAWDGLKMPYPAAIARLYEAECRVIEEDRERAAPVLDRARADAERLGST